MCPARAGKIDVYSSIPAYAQLASILRRQIEQGRTAPGDPLPSETTLQQQYEVSRGTVRKAIEMIRDHGLVVTVQGRGTFVKPEPRTP
jgi:DNA-binding GntR family transcriptional regulator